MEFIPVRDLRVQPGEVWRKLREKRDLVITSRGQPIALLIDVERDVEETLAAVRRARAQMAVSQMREAARAKGLDRLSTDEIEADPDYPLRAPRRMIVVLDTNVIVSALLSPFGAPARVLDMVLDGAVRLAYDDRLVGEYREVLARPRFGFDASAVTDLLEYLAGSGLPVVARPLAASLPDLDDVAFLEVAAASGAILITGNLRHYPEDERADVEALSPADFVARWQEPGTEG